MATKYKPILFSTEMVKAILEGRKTQTRRIVKQKTGTCMFCGCTNEDCRHCINSTGNPCFWINQEETICSACSDFNVIKKAKYQIGDILWVRETWQTTYNESTNNWDSIFKADGGFWIDDDGPMKWKPSIFMPRKRARIFLEVTNVRVERLQDISEDDVIAEGVEMEKKGDEYRTVENGELVTKIHEENAYYFYPGHDDFRDNSYMPRSVFPNAHISSFFSLWCLIHNEKSWQANPWVWVYEFKQIHHPKGFLNE